MTWQDKLLKQFAKLKQIKILHTVGQECGSILVFTAVGIPILLALVGFGFDVGNLYMHKARLQNVADAAALAGARAYVDNLDTTKGGTVTGGDTPSNPSHANEVAQEYVAKNSINLPNKIYHDFNSLKIRESDDSNTLYPNKAFYRIGLYENVPLYFLPVIKGIGKTQKVRAEAITLAIKGETTTIPGGGTSTTPTVKNPSIFDNLFTFSEYFDPGLANANHQHNETFEGNMVFTYGNGSSTKEHFYDIEKITGGSTQSVDHLFNDSSAELHAISNNSSYAHWTKVNDPIINTYFNTEAYMNAFKNKLNQPHYDNPDQNLTITGDKESNSTCRLKYTVASGTAQGVYQKVDNDYYLLDSNNEYTSFQSNGKTYTICYHKIPDTNYLVRCGKTDGDDSYHMLTSGNTITNCYIKTIQPDPNNAYWLAERALINNDSTEIHYSNGGFVDSNWQPMSDSQFNPSQPDTPVDINNFQQQTASGSSVSTNVYHVSSKFYGDVPNLTLNAIGEMSGDSNIPIYVIVEANITHIQINIKNNTRPIIFVYFGTNNVLINNNGISASDYAKLTIYAPYGTAGISPDVEQLNFDGTFYGNVIAKNIAIKASGGSGFTKWIQQNHLENANYTDTDVAAVTKEIEDTIKSATKLPDDVKAQIMQRYSNALTSYANLPDMDDPLFYSKLSYNAKQTLYTTWKALREEYPQYADSLWPWNEHFDIQAGEDQTVTTPDNIRIINPRVEENPFTIYGIKWKML